MPAAPSFASLLKENAGTKAPSLAWWGVNLEHTLRTKATYPPTCTTNLLMMTASADDVARTQNRWLKKFVLASDLLSKTKIFEIKILKNKFHATYAQLCGFPSVGDMAAEDFDNAFDKKVDEPKDDGHFGFDISAGCYCVAGRPLFKGERALVFCLAGSQNCRAGVVVEDWTTIGTRISFRFDDDDRGAVHDIDRERVVPDERVHINVHGLSLDEKILLTQLKSKKVLLTHRGTTEKHATLT